MSIRKDSYGSVVERDIRFLLFNAFMVITAVLGLVFMVVHIVNRRPLSNILIAVAIFGISTFWYLLSVKFNRYNISRRSYLAFMTFIYLPIGYWTSPGSTSAMLYLSLLVIFMLTFVAVEKWEYIFPVACMIEVIILLQTERWFPDHYYVYTDKDYRIIDISINYTVVVIAVICTIYFVMLKFNQHNELLYKLSITDSLTGLYNRRYFEESITVEYNRSVRTDEVFSLVFIDLNNFKGINDQHGHVIGDKVLADIAEIIKDNIRDYDVAARYGGDEFIIILPKTSEVDAKKHIERMNEAFRTYSQKYMATGFSVGFGLADSKDKPLDTIIKMADEALYIKKNEQKSRSESGL